MKSQLYFSCVILTGLLFYSCENNQHDNVEFYSGFNGARLSKIDKEGENEYTAYIYPTFEPVNKSPWFAFSITSKKQTDIKLTLNYGKYKHRYIPKLSKDKRTWEPIRPEHINRDTLVGTATLKLSINSDTLYVSAQEIESSQDTYAWIDDLLTKHSGIKKIIAGKTVMNKNNYVLEIESPKITNSLVLIARQHPPEIPGGTIGFKAFYEELLLKNELANEFRKTFNIYAFPLLNPDGTDMGNWRHNANGVDLNRDWEKLSQPETKMVDSFLTNKLKKRKTINFALDFHTSYTGPYLLVLDSINELKTKKIIPNWIQAIETNSPFRVEARRRSQELPYCYNYFYNVLNCEAVTYEEGDEIDRDIIKMRAKVYARELMKTLLKQVLNP